jgi:adenylyltransferase/sulfurtransferase
MSLPPLVEPVAELSAAERVRVSRHRALAGLGDEGQRRIAAARIGVVGAGGLGSPVVLALAAAGVGELVVFDDDVVEPSNLGRQIMHRRQDVGAPKAQSASRVASELSETRVREVRRRLTRSDAARLLDDVDVVIDGTESYDSREIVAEACETLGVPLVWGTVQEFAGQVTVFWSAPPAGTQSVGLHDLYPPGSEAPSCSTVGVFGPLCMQVGALMASEALKLVTGLGRPLLGRVALLDALAGTQREVPLRASRATDAAPQATEHTAADDTWETDDPDGIVIDVRERWELATGSIPGSVHVPLAEVLADAAGAAVRHRATQRRVVVVCQVGARARVAADALRAAGVDAVVLRGGIQGWVARQGSAS